MKRFLVLVTMLGLVNACGGGGGSVEKNRGAEAGAPENSGPS